jgi:antitoxin HicB
MGRYYELKLEPDSNDTLLVTAPRFPEVSTFGDTEAETLAHGLLAIEEAIAARIADGEDVPLPGDRRRRKVCVELPLMPFLKAALYMICRPMAPRV